jgi:hypothetical protein
MILSASLFQAVRLDLCLDIHNQASLRLNLPCLKVLSRSFLITMRKASRQNFAKGSLTLSSSPPDRRDSNLSLNSRRHWPRNSVPSGRVEICTH